MTAADSVDFIYVIVQVPACADLIHVTSFHWATEEYKHNWIIAYYRKHAWAYCIIAHLWATIVQN